MVTDRIDTLTGVGDRRAAALNDEGIASVADLLGYLPRRYLDRTEELRVADLQEGGEVTVVGRVTATRYIPGRRSRFIATVEDDSGGLECVWFGGGSYMKDLLERGDWVAVAGKPKVYRGACQMTHPEIEPIGDDSDRIHTGRVIPLYRTTEAMKKVGLTTRTIRRLVRAALDQTDLEEPLADDVRAGASVLSLADALAGIHFPECLEDVEIARRSLAFQEALEVRLWASRLRHSGDTTVAPIVTPGDLAGQLEESLSFDLTDSQERVLQEIWDDLTSGRPMHRLLQGEVGSGKTLVALLAGLPVVEAGRQVALMVPTEVLAEQHGATIRSMLAPLGVNVSVMTGSASAAEREASRALVASGRVSFVIGTHALIQEGIVFKDLGLAIVDEQHRFGVEQRTALRVKGSGTHVLVMTATPIPRSLALTLYGHLETSVIEGLPSGRQPITTGWRRACDREKAFSFLKEQVEAGQQAYAIYPLVEGSSATETRAATDTFSELESGALAGLRLGLLHGRMKSEAKLDVMGRFRSGEIDVLVATTVVEVGVDVPNATVMLVEHAERFGLSQLHQLRGRVGRGPEASYCILIVDPEDALTEDAHRRLEAMSRTQDGFEISEEDLRIRGSGHLFGTRQAGLPEFRYLDLARDMGLIEDAGEAAEHLLSSDPALESHPLLARRVAELEASDMRVPEAG